MYNIKQITNFDINNLPSISKIITVDEDPNPATKIRTVIYKVITNEYVSQKIEKLGYCCEPKAFAYPIFLTLEGYGEKKIEIGKTGMFEVQPEDQINIENIGTEEDITIKIIEIKVPWQWTDDPNPGPHGFNFKLDYAYN